MTQPSAITRADAERIVAAAPFARWWGVEPGDLGYGWAEVALAPRPALLRPGDVLHGASYEVVADVAMWLAVMTRTGAEPMAMTIEMKTSFLRGATTAIRSRAEVLRLGRRVVFGVATTTDTTGDVVAHSTLTYIRASPSARTGP